MLAVIRGPQCTVGNFDLGVGDLAVTGKTFDVIFKICKSLAIATVVEVVDGRLPKLGRIRLKNREGQDHTQHAQQGKDRGTDINPTRIPLVFLAFFPAKYFIGIGLLFATQVAVVTSPQRIVATYRLSTDRVEILLRHLGADNINDFIPDIGITQINNILFGVVASLFNRRFVGIGSRVEVFQQLVRVIRLLRRHIQIQLFRGGSFRSTRQNLIRLIIGQIPLIDQVFSNGFCRNVLIGFFNLAAELLHDLRGHDLEIFQLVQKFCGCHMRPDPVSSDRR